MPSVTITSQKLPNGFPSQTSFRLEWVSGQVQRKVSATKKANKFKERRLVWTSDDVDFEVTRMLDPGKYVWKAHKYTEEGFDNFSELGELLVGMTEEQWKKISHLKPRAQKPTMTTDGVIFTCGIPGCQKRNRNKIAALLHESKDHYGVDLLNEANPTMAAKLVDEQIQEEVVKRGPGRPRLHPEQ